MIPNMPSTTLWTSVGSILIHMTTNDITECFRFTLELILWLPPTMLTGPMSTRMGLPSTVIPTLWFLHIYYIIKKTPYGVSLFIFVNCLD